MIAKARSISHGSAMTNYATKHNRADMVLTRNLGDGLTPLVMWGAMETIHLKYAPKFRRKSKSRPFGWRFPLPLMKPKDGRSMTSINMRFAFSMSSRKLPKPRMGRKRDLASSIWTEHRFSPVFTLMRSLAFLTFTSSSTSSTLTEIS